VTKSRRTPRKPTTPCRFSTHSALINCGFWWRRSQNPQLITGSGQMREFPAARPSTPLINCGFWWRRSQNPQLIAVSGQMREFPAARPSTPR